MNHSGFLLLLCLYLKIVVLLDWLPFRLRSHCFLRVPERLSCVRSLFGFSVYLLHDRVSFVSVCSLADILNQVWVFLILFIVVVLRNNWLDLLYISFWTTCFQLASTFFIVMKFRSCFKWIFIYRNSTILRMTCISSFYGIDWYVLINAITNDFICWVIVGFIDMLQV